MKRLAVAATLLFMCSCVRGSQLMFEVTEHEMYSQQICCLAGGHFLVQRDLTEDGGSVFLTQVQLRVIHLSALAG